MKKQIFEKETKSPLEMYEEFVHKDALREKKFRVFAWASCLGFIIALLICFYAVNLPKQVPLVITVSDWGEAKYAGNISRLNYQGLKIPAVAIEYQIRKFVSNFYEIPGDVAVLKKNLRDCYASVDSATAEKLSNTLKEDNPLKNVGKTFRTIDIESVLKLTDSSYQADFVLSDKDKSASRVNRRRFRGILSIKLLEPAKDDMILNPLGIYITDFEFKEIKK